MTLIEWAIVLFLYLPLATLVIGLFIAVTYLQAKGAAD